MESLTPIFDIIRAATIATEDRDTDTLWELIHFCYGDESVSFFPGEEERQVTVALLERLVEDCDEVPPIPTKRAPQIKMLYLVEEIGA
jgi:hypothetical protein